MNHWLPVWQRHQYLRREWGCLCRNVHFATVSTTPTVFPAPSSFRIEASFFMPHFSHWRSCLFNVSIFIYDMIPRFKMFLGGGEILLLKIIWKLLDKRTFQISSSLNNQWIHASQPFRSTSMKYEMHVFNFPSSPSLNAFFFSFLSQSPQEQTMWAH